MAKPFQDGGDIRHYTHFLPSETEEPPEKAEEGEEERETQREMRSYVKSIRKCGVLCTTAEMESQASRIPLGGKERECMATTYMEKEMVFSRSDI